MVLRRDGACVEVQHQRYRGCVLGTHADEDVASGAWLPSWELLAISDGAIENVDWAAPDMAVLKARGVASAVGEDVEWSEPGGDSGNTGVEVYGVLNGKGPESGVCNFRPMNGGV